MIECRFCGEDLLAQDYVKHQDSCLEVPVSCPLCQGTGIKRYSLEEHTARCVAMPRPCPLIGFACPFIGADEAMGNHLSFSNHVLCFQMLKEELENPDVTISKLCMNVAACKI